MICNTIAQLGSRRRRVACSEAGMGLPPKSNPVGLFKSPVPADNKIGPLSARTTNRAEQNARSLRNGYPARPTGTGHS
jgi:hypothetical protein